MHLIAPQLFLGGLLESPLLGAGQAVQAGVADLGQDAIDLDLQFTLGFDLLLPRPGPLLQLVFAQTRRQEHVGRSDHHARQMCRMPAGVTGPCDDQQQVWIVYATDGKPLFRSPFRQECLNWEQEHLN